MEHKKYIRNGSNTFHTQLHKNTAQNLSRPAKQRLKWIEHFNKFRSARLTCRHFGISPDTFYLWRKRYDPNNLKTLGDNFKTRRPHKIRTSIHETMQLETIKKLKNIAPNIGKTRITRILRETGYEISSSTVGRILKTHKGLTLESKEP
jgi:transposase